jgi:hypothetical protein
MVKGLGELCPPVWRDRRNEWGISRFLVTNRVEMRFVIAPGPGDAG